MKRFWLSTVLVLLAGVVFAQNENDFKVLQLPDGTLSITGYTGSAKDIVIPARISGIAVSEIGKYTFQKKGLVSVVISSGITKISEFAFDGNKIISVTIPNSVTTIGVAAFSSNALTSVTIPNSVTVIGRSAFEDNALCSINIPNGVTSIGQDAFALNMLGSIVIPRSVTYVGSTAFGFGSKPRPVGSNRFINRISVVKLESVFDSPSRLGVFIADYITGITIPANWPSGTLENLGFDQNFTNFYISQGKKAGAYIKKGQIWTLGTAQEFQQILSEAQKDEQERAAQEKRAEEIRVEEKKAAELRIQQQKEAEAERQQQRQQAEAERQQQKQQAAAQQQRAEEIAALRNYEDWLDKTVSPLKTLITLKKFNNKQFLQFMNIYEQFLERTTGPDINIWYKYENEFIIPVKQKILNKKQLATFEREDRRAWWIQHGPEEYKREQEEKRKKEYWGGTF
jgi:hypothetical protein